MVGPVTAYAENRRKDIIDAVIREIAELPDRTSPIDEPEMMLVTGDELREILMRRISLMMASV